MQTPSNYSCGHCGSKMLYIQGGRYGWLLSCGNGHQLVSTGAEFWVFHTYNDDIGDVKFTPISGDHLESAILYTDPGPSIWDRIRVHFGFEPKTRGRILAKVDFDGRETTPQ